MKAISLDKKFPLQILSVFLLFLVLGACNSKTNTIEVDRSKHQDLLTLESNHPFKTLYSEGHKGIAEKQADLVEEARAYLTEIMGAKDEFYLLVVAESDWEKNAYSPVPGMPEYYKGNLILGAGKNSMAAGYAEMLSEFPVSMTESIHEVYGNEEGQLNMALFFDKLSIHELTHNFQDPNNSSGYSMSRWLEELHANMGLYAFFKEKRPEELKHITALVDFSLDFPPPGMKYKTLQEFDTYYYEMDPPNYGQYQMEFTKASETIIDSLGPEVLKPLNEFLKRYGEDQKATISDSEFWRLLAEEVSPYIVEVMQAWEWSE